MNTLKANTRNSRSVQKYFSCLIFVLLISYASCRQRKEDDAAILNDSDYTDVDDIEWGNFPIAETTTKGHPVIFYKEDIVSEDYDPNKDNKSGTSSKESKSQSRRKYKDINRRNRLNRTENYRYIKPDKVYFDVYPIEYDKTNEDDTKFNNDNIQVEVISLLDPENKNTQENGAYEKHMLNKRPKKVIRHHRQRRDASIQDSRIKNPTKRGVFFYKYVSPYYYSKRKYPIKSHHVNVPDPNAVAFVTTPRPVKTTKMPVIGNRINDDDNWSIWGSKPITTEVPRTRRPPPSLIHPGDESFASNNQESAIATIVATTTSRPRVTTSRPRTTFRPTQRAITRTTTTTPSAPLIESASVSWNQFEKNLEPAPVGIQPCIWAVATCCKTHQTDIQYTCFEYLGCIGSFWDVNPCSPRFVEGALATMEDYYRSK